MPDVANKLFWHDAWHIMTTVFLNTAVIEGAIRTGHTPIHGWYHAPWNFDGTRRHEGTILRRLVAKLFVCI